MNKCARLDFKRDNALPSVPVYILGGHSIPNVTQYKDLGVNVDVTMKFHCHICEIYGKASGVAMSILWDTVYCSPEFLSMAFVTHVRQIMEFASVVWCTGYLGDVNLLENVQRRIT